MQRILVIDDDPAFAAACQRAFSAAGNDVQCHEDPVAGLGAALSGVFDVIFLDVVMPEIGGVEILRQVKVAGVAAEVVMLTGHPTVEGAVEVMKLGAADYLAKPLPPERLTAILREVAERSARMKQNALLRLELQENQQFEGMIGESRAMESVFSLIRRVAPTEGTILITGESGTGKEMVVRAIHRLSRRRDEPLLACDCTALAPTLLESELFGHVKGSFSGAIATKRGLLEVADRGTLFLDEIANLSLETQSKLLRVLETKRVRKVGDTVEHPIDIRLLTATNRDLSELVREGAFREDLYYRLNVVPMFLPPLRQREGDIPLLATSFLYRICRKMGIEPKRFTPEAMSHMESYHWPGNVRELRNIVERLAILSDGELIEAYTLPIEIRQTPVRGGVTQLPDTWEEFRRLKQKVGRAAVDDLERRFLVAALRRCRGNVTKAAERIGIQRTNLHALLRRHGLTGESGADAAN